MKKLIGAMLLTALFLSACKKEKTTLPTTQQLLTSHAWFSDSLYVNGAARPEWCWQNSIYSYHPTDSVLAFTQGTNSSGCLVAAVGTTVDFKWWLIDNNTKLVTQIASYYPIDTSEILSITSTRLTTKRIVNSGTEVWIIGYAAD